MNAWDPVGRVLGLPPVRVRRVRVDRAVPVPMSDGTVLRADHYAPAAPDLPTVLVRTPYPRGGSIALLCRAVARRGFHVLVQSCRGTGDSGGVFEPMRDERADGIDTIAWLRALPWYDGRLLTYGPSYVGFVQWAVAADAGADLRAMSTIVTAASFADSTYAGGSFSLDTVLTWASSLAAQRPGRRFAVALESLRGQPRLRRGLVHLPLAEADRVATGAEVGYYQRWLTEADPTAPYWVERGHTDRLADIEAPVLMIGGWQDIFLPWQLADYAALRAAGRRPYLTIGPWHHGSLGLVRQGLAQSVAWFRAHTEGGAFREAPVRVYVDGAREWRDYQQWPPPGIAPRSYHLLADGRLGSSLEPPAHPVVAAFTYDPADPTPAVGGPRLVGGLAGRRDNRRLEARPDVVTFTTGVLTAPVESIGPVVADLCVEADGPSFDVFVRLCDVDPRGRSWNVCDGLRRVTSAGDGTGLAVRVELWPTAYRFAVGHRIRLQVSGGAHPRFARNPGTGDGLGVAGRRLRPVHLKICYPSSISLSTGPVSA